MTNPAAAQSQDIDCLSPEAQRLAEARLAAKRAARAEAREIRMKELERQQKEPSEHGGHLNSCSRASSARASPLVEERPDKDFAEKGARNLPGLSAATLASLGGTSSRRGSGDTSVSLDTEASIREMKDSLVEAEDKYRKAMVSNAQLDNEKTNFMYQVDALKDLLLELEEQLAEAQRQHEDKSRELEREKQAHSALRFQFAEVKEALKQRDKMLEALERQKEFFDSVRTERDDLRGEVAELKGELKKHGIILHSEAATSREMSHTLKDGSCPGPSTVTEEELNTLKAMSDGTLGRAPEAEATEAAVAEVGSKILPSSEQERPPEAPEGPVLPPAQDHTSAASEDGAPSPPGTLDRAPAPDAASPDSAAEAEPRGARTPPGAGTGTSPESDGRGGASRDPEAGQGGAQASPSETPSEGVTEEQEGGSPGGAVPQEPPESQRAGSTDGGPGANPTGDMQENQGAGGGGHVASGPAGREEEERGAITPQELAPSGDPPGAHEEEQSEPCGDVRDSSQKKSKSRKKKNRKKKATAAAGAGKGAEKQLSFESTGSSHAEEDAQGTPAGEPGAGTQGQGAETTAQRERADCPEDPSPERDGRDGPGTQDSDTGEATANGDTVSCAGKGAESPATSRAVSSGDGGEEGTSRGHGIPPESEDELDDQGPWEDAVDAPPLEGVAGLSQPISRQGLESISLDSEDLSPDSEPQGLRPQGQQEAGGGSEMGKSKEDCALC